MAGSLGRARPSLRFALTLLVLAGPATRLHAVDLFGSVRLFWSQLDDGQNEGEFLEQQYGLTLTQRLTPYLLLRVGDRYSDYETTADGESVYRRRLQRPRIELLYSRAHWTGRIGYDELSAEGSDAAGTFDASNLNSSLSWDPAGAWRFSAGFYDRSNQSDLEALGRDTESRGLQAESQFTRSHWGASARWSSTDVENRFTGLEVRQERQEMRLQGARGFFGDRLHLGVAGLAGRAERRGRVGEGELAEPVAASQGLAAIDLSPDVGELDFMPGLIDGDVESGTIPEIEIGGGNTYRNVGVEFIVTQPIDRLEVYVDRPSDPQLLWEVYSSNDNLFWQPVGGVRREWDPALQRYTLRFPETTARALKAVNVSVNAAAEVRVTELRALRSTTVDPGPERTVDLYQVDLNVGWEISRRLRASAAYGVNNDQTSVAELVRRDTTAESRRAGLEFDLARAWTLSVQYNADSYDDAVDRRLQRDTDNRLVSLRWRPLPTVDAELSASTREESEEGERLQYSEVSRMLVSLQLLPDLRLVSTLTYDQTDDPALDFDRESVSFSQRLDARPLENWLVSGGFFWSRVDSAGLRLLDRQSIYLNTDWSPGTWLTLSANWRYFDDGGTTSLRQGYGLSFDPGPRLSVSMAHDEYDATTGRFTENSSVSLSYRLGNRILLSAAVAQSRTELDDGEAEKVRSARFGTVISF